MLDAAFNHTAYDCELAAAGVYYFKTNGALWATLVRAAFPSGVKPKKG